MQIETRLKQTVIGKKTIVIGLKQVAITLKQVVIGLKHVVIGGKQVVSEWVRKGVFGLMRARFSM